MLPVNVRRHDHLVVLPLLRKLQRNLVSLLRRDGFLRMKGLDEVIVHPAAVFSVLQLGADELGVAALRLAVQTCDELAAFVHCFLRQHRILEDGAHAAARLSLGPVDGIDCRHGSHRPLQNFLQHLLDRTVDVAGLREID